MYPYSTPGAFMPHSAINLSVKPGADGQPQQQQATSSLTSLDLSITDGSGAATNSYHGPTSVAQHEDSSSTSYVTSNGMSSSQLSHNAIANPQLQTTTLSSDSRTMKTLSSLESGPLVGTSGSSILDLTRTPTGSLLRYQHVGSCIFRPIYSL